MIVTQNVHSNKLIIKNTAVTPIKKELYAQQSALVEKHEVSLESESNPQEFQFMSGTHFLVSVSHFNRDLLKS